MKWYRKGQCFIAFGQTLALDLSYLPENQPWGRKFLLKYAKLAVFHRSLWDDRGLWEWRANVMWNRLLASREMEMEILKMLAEGCECFGKSPL